MKKGVKMCRFIDINLNWFITVETVNFGEKFCEKVKKISITTVTEICGKAWKKWRKKKRKQKKNPFLVNVIALDVDQ